MRRILVLGLLATSSSIACSADRDSEEQPKAPAHTQAPVEPSSEPPVEELPTHMSNQVVTITASLARAKGLPPLGFSLDFTGTAFTVSAFVEGSYLYASGPPGGPLGLQVSPIARKAEFAGVVGGARDREAKLIHEQVELLGASRRAVAWISGESMARTSWCAVIVEPEPSGDDALLIELGVGHQGDDVSCKTALGHSELAKVVASLRFE